MSRVEGFPEAHFTIPVDSVCYVVVKARELDVKEGNSDPDSGSNASDDHMVSVLEEGGDDPVSEELTSFIDDLNEDAQADLVALTWLGRGDGAAADWASLRHEARRARNARTSAYLLGLPMLADYLEQGLSEFGLSCTDFERDHL